MKKLLFLLVLPIFLTNCKEDTQDPVLFDAPFRIDFEIQAGLNTVEDHFYQFQNIHSPIDSLLSFYGYSLENITSISPKSARLISVFAGDNYDFLQEVSLSLFDKDGNRSEAFWRPEIPFNTKTFLDVPGTLIDAQRYLLEPKVNFELQLDTREITSSFIDTRLEITFAVRGK